MLCDGGGDNDDDDDNYNTIDKSDDVGQRLEFEILFNSLTSTRQVTQNCVMEL